MGALGVWALAIGAADLIAPTDTAEHARGRMWLATVALPVVSALAAVGIGLSPAATISLCGVTVLSGGLWLWLRAHPRGALAALTVAFVSLLVTAGYWMPQRALLGPLVERSPFVGAELDFVVLNAGLVLLLIGTANRVVRIVLDRVEVDLLGQEKQLKGGRVIGPLERLLVYGLGVTGQLVAAGLVVAAKSLLRFGEVRTLEEEIDETRQQPLRAELMSEYLLVGSLLSWSLAFLLVGLAAAAARG